MRRVGLPFNNLISADFVSGVSDAKQQVMANIMAKDATIFRELIGGRGGTSGDGAKTS